MSWEITRVRRMAEDAVALLVGRMLDGVRRQGVARYAELIGGRNKSDVGSAFDVGDRVANGATHGDCRVHMLPRGLVVVAFETLRRVRVCGEKNGMLLNVGARRRSENQQDQSNQEDASGTE